MPRERTPARAEASRRNGARGGRPMMGAADDDDDQPSDLVQARARAKLRRERADARRAEALADEIEGRSMRTTEVAAKLCRWGAAFRRICQQAPNALDHKAIPPEHIDICKAAVARAMTLALQATAREFENLNDPGDHNGITTETPTTGPLPADG